MNFYDPNQTATHKRVFFCTNNICGYNKPDSI
ncbi:hypothetical protein [Escherichia coli]